MAYAFKLIADALRGKMAGRIDAQIWKSLCRAAFQSSWRPVTFGTLWDLTRGEQSRADNRLYDARKMAIAILVSVLKRIDLPKSQQPQASGGWLMIMSDALNLNRGHVGNLAHWGRKLLVEYGAPVDVVEAMRHHKNYRKAATL